MKRIFVLGVFFSLLSLLISACGGSAEDATPVSSMSVEMSEFKFSPSSMVVFAGQEISLSLSNKGAVQHDFTILKKGINATSPFDPQKQAGDILFEAKLGANQSGEYKFTLPEAGEYQVVCATQGHLESGMVATLKAK